MKHIKPISEPCLRQSLAHGGCGECQSSCQDQLHRRQPELRQQGQPDSGRPRWQGEPFLRQVSRMASRRRIAPVRCGVFLM